MKNVSIYLLLSLAVFVAAPVMAAADKKEAVVEPKREVKTEADVLKELEKYSPAALAQLKAAFLPSVTINNCKHAFYFSKLTSLPATGIKESVQLNSSLEEPIDSITTKLDEQPGDLVSFNEPVRLLQKSFEKQDSKLWFWQSYSYYLEAEKMMKCRRRYVGQGATICDCTTELSKELHALLGKKLKENPKFLDDRINKK